MPGSTIPSPKFPGSLIASASGSSTIVAAYPILRAMRNCFAREGFSSSDNGCELITPHHQQLRYHLLDLLLPRKAYTEVHSTRATVVFSQGRGQIPAHASILDAVRWLQACCARVLSISIQHPQCSPSQPALVRPPPVITSRIPAPFPAHPFKLDASPCSNSSAAACTAIISL